ncbi:MAG: Asp-tRNA(Asn)/Glu-tRNA(Gln) amidotransferase subunit GatC [Chloroflexota bacterium]
MAELTRKDVEHIAKLARLELTEEELKKYGESLASILEYADKLNDLELDDVPPTAHAVAQQNVIRKDEVNSSLAVDKALANAAQAKDDQFAIQAVFDD